MHTTKQQSCPLKTQLWLSCTSQSFIFFCYTLKSVLFPDNLIGLNSFGLGILAWTKSRPNFPSSNVVGRAKFGSHPGYKRPALQKTLLMSLMRCQISITSQKCWLLGRLRRCHLESGLLCCYLCREFNICGCSLKRQLPMKVGDRKAVQVLEENHTSFSFLGLPYRTSNTYTFSSKHLSKNHCKI